MRQQTKPFIVEIKQSRKLKCGNQKPSIWRKLDLSFSEDTVAPAQLAAPATVDNGDRL
jgi:hypothetical protein